MGTAEDERDLRATYQRPHMYFFRKTPDALSRSRRDRGVVYDLYLLQSPSLNLSEYSFYFQL